ncbi:hypothetical protein [Kitasatospora sp. NBC_01266]|uniref:hypothetical protein n=1 Tax=Kitasatospora sp. NBC_01266 TaxID=2903572 RepID=UPI002E349893|nr:hypothetical protein [Kitasatospora sp. NBC_01266]
MTTTTALAHTTADSLRLRETATQALRDHLLPAIRTHLPEIENRISVNITSSVAYGAADEHSDLDVFVMFERERDYAQHASGLQKLIDNLHLDALYGAVCDKGMRFEIESLARADLSAIYHHSERPEHWHRQSEWLLSWFLDSHPIHDPSGIHARLQQRAGRWPDGILLARQDDALTRISAWTGTARRFLVDQGPSFVAVRSAYRAATASLELAYLQAGLYAPHPKWRSAYAAAMLRNHHEAQRRLEVHQRLAQGLASPSWTTCGMDDLLLGHLDANDLSNPPSPADGWLPVLRDHAELFVDEYGSIWAARDRAPGRAFHVAARAAAAMGETVYLGSELGCDRIGSRTYDGSMRVAEPLRWLIERQVELSGRPAVDSNSSARHRRWRFLNFIIWRKLRVVNKASQRGHSFTCRWYQLQVVDHLMEAQALLAGTHLPPLHRYESSTLGFLTVPMVRALTEQPAEVLIGDVQGFLRWGWREFADLQLAMTKRGLLSDQAARDPLATQWEIQYWKYENLFN